MNNKHLIGMAALGFAFVFTACSKGDKGDPGPSFSGAISGHVMLYDQYGTKVNTDLSGIQVTLSNSSTVVTTDVNGYYIFTGVSTRDYTIMVHDPNTSPYAYGDNVAVNFQYLADTLIKDIKLSAIPSFSPSAMTATLSSVTGNDSLVFSITPDSRVRDIIVFVNNTSTVNNLPANYLLTYVKAVPANASVVSLLVPANDLHDQGINTGSTAYFAAYGYPVSDESVYEDITSGKSVYNALSGSSVTASAVAP
jgi:hypothetical protein